MPAVPDEVAHTLGGEMAKKATGRGSKKMSAAAVSIKSKLRGVKIIDWQEVGTPDPEVIMGTVHMNPASFRTQLGALTRLKELRDLDILINGTPRPDLAQIRFTLRR